MKNNQKKQKNNNLILGIAAVIVIGVAVFTFLNSKNNEKDLAKETKPEVLSATDENGDMIIKVEDVTENATFYSYDELNTYMEVLAVKASDGTVRTAFNTCQVCYASGRGYYVQEGDALICQNCGNRFKMDAVEVSRGGCNPVPIYKEWKEETDSTITISKELFVEAEGIFENWK